MTDEELIERLRSTLSWHNNARPVIERDGILFITRDTAVDALGAMHAELAKAKAAIAVLDPAAESFHERLICAESEVNEQRARAIAAEANVARLTAALAGETRKGNTHEI